MLQDGPDGDERENVPGASHWNKENSQSGSQCTIRDSRVFVPRLRLNFLVSPVSTMAKIRRVLFVCAGNICRSPMAEAIFRHLAQDHLRLAEIEVGSAGTIAANGNRPLRETVEVVRDEFGLEISGHRARRVTKETQADLILTADSTVTSEVSDLALAGHVEMLGDYAGTGEEIEDPYGGSEEAYHQCARTIRRLVEAVIRRLQGEDHERAS